MLSKGTRFNFCKIQQCEVEISNFPTCPLKNYVMQNIICTYNMRWVACFNKIYGELHMPFQLFPTLTRFILDCIYPSNCLLLLPKGKRLWIGVRFGNKVFLWNYHVYKWHLKYFCVHMMDEHVPYKCMHLDPMTEVSRSNFEPIQRVESLHVWWIVCSYRQGLCIHIGLGHHNIL